MQEVSKQIEGTALHSDQQQWNFWLGLHRELRLDRGGFDEDDPDSRIVMLQGEDVWTHQGDELERLLLNGICGLDSVEGAESDDHVIHSTTPSIQENTLNENPKSVNSEDLEDDPGGGIRSGR